MRTEEMLYWHAYLLRASSQVRARGKGGRGKSEHTLHLQLVLAFVFCACNIGIQDVFLIFILLKEFCDTE